MATTPDAIVDRMAALVTAITPGVHAQPRFSRHREEIDFRAWAEANPSACLRRFSITNLGDVTQALVTDHRTERVEETIEVVVAYPADFRHGGRQLGGLRSAIAKDAVQIEAAIGVPSSDATLKSLASIFRVSDADRESSGPVMFLVLRYRVEYARSLT